MPYYVYILQSQKDHNYYIGSTSNVEKRLKYHNSGLQRSTKNRIPFTLMYTERYDTKNQALRREKQIKSYKEVNNLKEILKQHNIMLQFFNETFKDIRI